MNTMYFFLSVCFTISTGILLFARYVDDFGIKVSSGYSYVKKDAVVFFVEKTVLQVNAEVDIKKRLPEINIMVPTTDFIVKDENFATSLAMVNKII